LGFFILIDLFFRWRHRAKEHTDLRPPQSTLGGDPRA
jgi:hypothetical protein